MFDLNLLLLCVLFCCGVLQNFFDLLCEQIGEVWQVYGVMFVVVEVMFGVCVFGVMDDDCFVVGQVDGVLWIFYIMVDVVDFDMMVVVCNLYCMMFVGEYNLWCYGKIEVCVGCVLIVLLVVKFVV